MTPFILYVLKANGLLLLVLGFYFLFLRKETFFAAIRYYFLIGIACSFLLPLMSFTKTVYIEQRFDWSMLLNQTNEVPRIEEQQNFFEQLNIEALLPVLFGGITLIIGLFFCGKVLRLIRHIKQLQFWKSQSNIKVDTNTKEAYSFWNWIVLPSNYKDIAALETIIQHEHIHVQQKHTVDLLLVNFLRRIFWFNPLLVILERVVRLNLEYIVDQKVTARQNSYEYQMTLVQFEEAKTPSFSLVNSFGSSDLKKRIIMLNQPKSRNMKKSKFVLCLPLVVGFFLLFQVHTKAEIRFVNQETTTTEQEPEKKPEASETTILRNNGEESSTAQKETLDALMQKVKEGAVSETAEANQAERGTIYVTTNDPSGKIKMTLNGKELTEEEHRLHTEKRMAEGKNQTYMFTSTGTDSKTRIVINGKEYSMEDFAKLGKESQQTAGTSTTYFHTHKGEELSEEVKKAIEEAKKSQEETKRAIESSRRQIEESKKAMIESRKAMDESKETRAMAIEDAKKALAETREVREKALAESRKVMEESKEARKQAIEAAVEARRQANEALQEGKGQQYKKFTVVGGTMRNEELSWPKYIIDGVHVKDSDIINSLDPNDIEKVHVIKGEKAVKEYGEEAKNGVILVTTKKK